MLCCTKKKNIGWLLMVIQNHALPDSDQSGNPCYRSLIHRYYIGSQNAIFSILCSYFFLYKKVVIVIAVGEKGGHPKKVILSSKLNNYAPVFLLFSVILSYFPPIFSGEKILFSYFSGRPMCWAPCICFTISRGRGNSDEITNRTEIS